MSAVQAAHAEHAAAMAELGWDWYAAGNAWHSPTGVPNREHAFVQIIPGGDGVEFEAYQAESQLILGHFPTPVAAAMATQLVRGAP